MNMHIPRHIKVLCWLFICIFMTLNETASQNIKKKVKLTHNIKRWHLWGERTLFSIILYPSDSTRSRYLNESRHCLPSDRAPSVSRPGPCWLCSRPAGAAAHAAGKRRRPCALELYCRSEAREQKPWNETAEEIQNTTYFQFNMQTQQESSPLYVDSFENINTEAVWPEGSAQETLHYFQLFLLQSWDYMLQL